MSSGTWGYRCTSVSGAKPEIYECTELAPSDRPVHRVAVDTSNLELDEFLQATTKHGRSELWASMMNDGAVIRGKSVGEFAANFVCHLCGNLKDDKWKALQELIATPKDAVAWRRANRAVNILFGQFAYFLDIKFGSRPPESPKPTSMVVPGDHRPSFNEILTTVQAYVHRPPARCKSAVTAILWTPEDDEDHKFHWEKVFLVVSHNVRMPSQDSRDHITQIMRDAIGHDSREQVPRGKRIDSGGAMLRMYGKHTLNGHNVKWGPTQQLPEYSSRLVSAGHYTAFQQSAFSWWDTFAPEITTPIINRAIEADTIDNLVIEMPSFGTVNYSAKAHQDDDISPSFAEYLWRDPRMEADFNHFFELSGGVLMEPATGCRFMFYGQRYHGTTAGYDVFEPKPPAVPGAKQELMKRTELESAMETTPVQFCTVFMQTKRYMDGAELDKAANPRVRT